MKGVCFPSYYCGKDEDAWEQLIDRHWVKSWVLIGGQKSANLSSSTVSISIYPSIYLSIYLCFNLYGYWRKLFPSVCCVMFCNFRHAFYERRIFIMLNNFVHEWTSPHSLSAFWAISSTINADAHAFFSCFTEVKMA